MEYYKNLSLEDLFYINDDGLVCCEEWKDIPDYEGHYKASDLGRCKSLRFGKIRIFKQNISGKYYQICFSFNSVKRVKDVHQLVAMAFLGHIPCGMDLVVDHIDTNKLNNRASNLRIVTSRVNSNKKHLKSTSQYTGVTYCKSSKKWIARIVINGNKKHIGYFIDEDYAGMAYKIALENIDKFNENMDEFRTLINNLL